MGRSLKLDWQRLKSIQARSKLDWQRTGFAGYFCCNRNGKKIDNSSVDFVV